MPKKFLFIKIPKKHYLKARLWNVFFRSYNHGKNGKFQTIFENLKRLEVFFYNFYKLEIYLWFISSLLKLTKIPNFYPQPKILTLKAPG